MNRNLNHQLIGARTDIGRTVNGARHVNEFGLTHSTSPRTFPQGVRALFARVSFAVLAVSILAGSAGAQQSNVDGVVPPALAPGAPAGSYVLSDFEQISMYNGRLNVRIPLLAIGGRGGAGYTIFANATKTSWVVESNITGISCTPSPGYCPTWLTLPTNNWWNPPQIGAVGYSPGHLLGRRAGGTLQFCSDPEQPSGFQDTITTLVFTSADGNETVLYDQGYNSTVRTANCGQPINDLRGRIFTAIDGSGMTFVSDEDIYDYPGSDLYSIGADVFRPSGLLKMKDGTIYVIKNSYVTFIRDRNGNEVKLLYTSDPPTYPATLVGLSDSLRRGVTFEYGVNDGSYGLCDRIIYRGFNGTQRIVRVSFANLSAVLRSDFVIANYNQLFPELPSGGSIPYNAMFMSSIWLPDGVRKYSFRYNNYGELAQVTLPTGGVIAYDYAAGIAGGYSSGQVGDPYPPNVHFENPPQVAIYRRLTERRTYPDGVNRETKTTYSRPESLNGTQYENLGYVDEVHKGSGEGILSKTRHYFSGAPYADLFFHDPVNLFPRDLDGREVKTEILGDGDVVLRRIENTWGRATNTEVIQESKTSLLDVSPALVSKESYQYGQFDNRTVVDEYDFGSAGQPGILKRRTSTQYETSATYTDALNGPHLRSLPLSQLVFDGGDLLTPVHKVTYAYDNYTDGLTDRADISRHNASYNTTFLTRGNVTASSAWLLPSTPLTSEMQYDIAGNVVKTEDPRGFTTQLFYDDNFGAPNDSNSQFNTAPNELSSVNQKSYALLTKVINAATPGHTSYGQYSYYLGRPVDVEDANGVVTSIYYSDSLDRLTQGIRASNTAIKNQISFTYLDSTRIISSTSDQATYGDNLLHSESTYDMMGRLIESRQYAPEGVLKAVRTYDALNRVVRVTNPYRLTTEDTYGYSDTSYDRLGRELQVTTFDRFNQSTGSVAMAYLGNTTTVTDQAGKKRRSVTDGLGRLIRIDEPDSNGNLDNTATPPQPLQSTSYLYDVLDNLVKVTQGAQDRYFMYDSLNRLIRARNPEQGTNSSLQLLDPITGNSQWSMKYTYDENSNLLTKVDARGTNGLTSFYSYDPLNRVTSLTYSPHTEATPSVHYYYDGQALPDEAPSFTRGASIGRLVAVLYGGPTSTAGNYTGYDSLGQAAVSLQETDDEVYLTSYEYNLAGAMTRETYPSGKQVRTSYDNAGRTSQVSRYISGVFDKTYASDFNYTPHGAVSAIGLSYTGTVATMTEETDYNSRLQPTMIELRKVAGNQLLLGLDYGYGATGTNNGNIGSQTIRIGTNTPIVQSYTYDHLNRLGQTIEKVNTVQQWQQTYDYDQWGNRAVRAGLDAYIPGGRQTPTSTSAGDLPLLFNQATNRIIATSEYAYDPAGNLTSMPNKVSGADAATYDAQNRQLSYTKAGGGGTTNYSYDGDGRRVKKVDVTGNVTTVFVYDVTGQLIAEYTNATSPPSGGGGTSYLTTDLLGSTRSVTRADASVKARYDYLPFGEEIGAGVAGRSGEYGGSDSTKHKFTEKERDTESGLDYFLARYYSSAQGRFTSPDEFAGGPDEFWILGSGDSEKQALPYAEITNPQSLNKYQYGYNNPLRYVDPDGHQQKETYWERVQRYWATLINSRVNWNWNRENDKPKPNVPFLPSEEKIVEGSFEQMKQGLGVLSDVLELMDRTGSTSVVRNVMEGGSTEGLVIAIAGMAFGGGKSNVVLGEAKALVGGWTRRTFSTIADSLRYHFGKHGAEVGAKDVWQYLRKAEAFKGNLRGAARTYLDGGLVRYEKNGRYIILDSERRIVSFGAL